MAYDKVVDSAVLDTALVGIANAIRGKTGGTEKLTIEQMAAAIAGIQAGGGDAPGGGASGVYIARITPAENLTGMFPITHNLGTTDILYVAVWAESLGGITPTDANTLCKMWAKSDIPTRRNGNGFSVGYAWSSANSYADTISPNTGAYETLRVKDANTIELPRAASGSSSYYLAGVTYTVIVIAANAEV